MYAPAPILDRIDSGPLLSGLAGTGQTLRLMAQAVRDGAADPWIRQRALEIVSACGGHQFDCEVRALFTYCRDQITYRRDPVQNEWVQDAKRTMAVFGTGDCDDKCVCLATLLGALGHKARFVCVGKDAHNYSHVYVEVRTKRGDWIPLDPTPEQAHAGWETRGLHRAVYDIWDSPNTEALTLLAVGLLAFWLLR